MFYLLGYRVVESGESQLMFRRSIPPLSSGFEADSKGRRTTQRLRLCFIFDGGDMFRV
jgi:hypothetical protein